MYINDSYFKAPFATGDLKPSQNNLKMNKNAFKIVTVIFQWEMFPHCLIVIIHMTKN